MLTGKPVNHITGPVLRTRPPAIALPARATLPAIVIGAAIIKTGIAAIVGPGIALPVRIVAGTSGNILIVTTAWRLSLLHRIGTWLDAQVISRLRRTILRVALALRAGLPLPALRPTLALK